MSEKILLESAKYAADASGLVPSDGALPALSLLNRPTELVGLLSSLLREWLGTDRRILDCCVTLLRYVPGKRCLVALELRIGSKESGEIECRKLIGKVHANGQGKRVYDTLQELRNHSFADGRLTVGEPLAYDPHWQLLLLSHSKGQLLRDLILTRSDLDWATEGAAQWLAKLHRCGVTRGRCYSLQDHLRTLGTRKQGLEQVSPEAARRFGEILARIECRSSELTQQPTPGPTHRDFSPDHLLVDGAHFTGLDFDEFCRYDSLFDVAHFMAHVGYLGLLHSGSLHRFASLAERFSTTYQAYARNQSLARLELRLALSYLKLAQIVALVTRPVHWQPIMDALLAEAQQFSQMK